MATVVMIAQGPKSAWDTLGIVPLVAPSPHPHIEKQ